jgi:N-acetyl-1-D-myo-inositol-2-amino-2-deoxy-alpha-D-glucopyranoside deacetylase
LSPARAVPRLVTAFAHPDDETFSVGGCLARAVEQGALVTAICATRGEVGEIADPSLATPETLGQVREGELRAACAVLGVTDVRFLDYRDSGMAGTAENEDTRAFARAADDDVVAKLVALFRELRPDVVVTFEPEGVYGHPDHKKISACTTLAFDRAPVDGWAPKRLFYAGASRSMFRAMQQEFAKMGIERNAAFDQPDLGIPDEQITTVVDVSRFTDRKARALEEHRTQINPALRAISAKLRDRMLARESFVLIRGDLTAGVKTDLLADLG